MTAEQEAHSLIKSFIPIVKPPIYYNAKRCAIHEVKSIIRSLGMVKSADGLKDHYEKVLDVIENR